MTPQNGAAASGTRKDLRMNTVFKNAARTAHISCLGLSLVAFVTLTGCCCYNDCVDTALKRTEARMAYSDPCECDASGVLGVDYKRGWRAGYLEVSDGRSGTPPVVPPHRYRTYKYQTGSGKQAAAAWYQGFAAGAAAAKCQGLDNANRVFSVESPCCICNGPCQCQSSTSGALPSAGAMLRRQAMQRSHVMHQGQLIEERIIEERFINDRPASQGHAPTPAAEALEQPPADGASLQQSTETEPELVAAAPQKPENQRSTPDSGALVDREIDPPAAVELPSNIGQLQESLRPAKSPLAQSTIDSNTVAEKPPVKEPNTVAVTQEPSKREQSESHPSPLAPVEDTVVQGPVIAVPPVEVPHSSVTENTDEPYRFKPFDQSPVVKAPTNINPLPITELRANQAPEAVSIAPITQPGGILLDQPQRKPTPSQLAPVPQTVVRETPKPAPLPAVRQQPAMPPQPFPSAMIVERDEAVAVPDSIAFPSGLQPPSQPEQGEGTPRGPMPTLAPAPVASKSDSQLVMPPFATAVTPSLETENSGKLLQPQEIRVAPSSLPAIKTNSPSQPAAPIHRGSSLPRKLVETPNKLAMPVSIASTPQKPSTNHHVPSNAPRQEQVLAQPTSLRTSSLPVPPLELLPSRLSYPADIQYSLSKHQFDGIATPVELAQPNSMAPDDKSNDTNAIMFPQTVWPTAYEVMLPPVR